MKSRWLLSLVALSLVIAACGGNGGATTTTAAPEETTTTGGGDTTTTTTGSGEIEYDVGVTPAPCEDAVNDGNGCIYLGIISDLTTGPFAALGVPLTAAQRHFWNQVNADGGLDGFDVIIRDDDVIDAHYTPEDTAAGYETIRGRVLALAQSLGTPQTQSIIDRMEEDNVVAAPATWWSGWNFPEEENGLILESGASYCIEAMNGMSFMSTVMPEGFTWALVRFPGDYGGDYGAGALIAASMLGLGDPLFDLQLVPISAGGAVTEAVGRIVAEKPDLIVLVSGPVEMAQIAAGTFQGGHTEFQILGASPTWNVALKANADLMPLLEGVYKGTTPWGGWTTDTPGHAAMRASAEENWFDPNSEPPRGPNGAYSAGWTWQYPIKALLEAAIASGDLTRANVASIAKSLDGVDYQGILPTRNYSGTANDNAVRTTFINKADSASEDGLSPISDGAYTADIVADFDYQGPCFTG
ncbi:MAG TPA: ABC transporter substrate-binding protein [Acidimicrobiia bacterium]